MMRVRPGLAFSLVCDRGFAVGLVTHRIPRMGDLVWLAEPTFDDEPDMPAVQSVDGWRWPVFFPMGAALRRRLVTPIGVTEIPPALVAMPRMRGGNRQTGWREVCISGDGSEQIVEVARDPSMPISQVVNDTRLKEMLVTDWRPEKDW